MGKIWERVQAVGLQERQRRVNGVDIKYNQFLILRRSGSIEGCNSGRKVVFGLLVQETGMIRTSK